MYFSQAAKAKAFSDDAGVAAIETPNKRKRKIEEMCAFAASLMAHRSHFGPTLISRNYQVHPEFKKECEELSPEELSACFDNACDKQTDLMIDMQGKSKHFEATTEKCNVASMKLNELRAQLYAAEEEYEHCKGVQAQAYRKCQDQHSLMVSNQKIVETAGWFRRVSMKKKYAKNSMTFVQTDMCLTTKAEVFILSPDACLIVLYRLYNNGLAANPDFRDERFLTGDACLGHLHDRIIRYLCLDLIESGASGIAETPVEAATLQASGEEADEGEADRATLEKSSEELEDKLRQARKKARLV